MNSRAGIAAALLVCGSALSAQTIRGTLTDPTSHPVAGAVVVLLDTTSHQVARTLSSDRGDFAFQKIASGTYRLRILRIGYFPFESNAISSGATIQLQLPPTLIALDTFHVTAKPVCHTAPGDAATIYAAWDQVRTALTATQLTTDDHALVATTIRTERWLDVDGRRVLGENSASVSRPVEQPWHSVSGDVLHKSGYVDIRPDSITYRAPDLDALASDQFIDDHCFRVERSAGRVGIAFAPIPQRDNLPEITGTAWIDSTTAELRKVEYEYVHLAGLLGVQSGAKLDFLPLKDGSWAISRWSIQAPYVAPVEVSGTLGLRVRALQVTRGDLALVRRDRDTLWLHPPVILEGTVRDSATNDPIPEAEVSLQGTKLGAYTDIDGHFGIVGVLPGEYVANVRTPSLDSLNAGTQRVVWISDSSQTISVKTLNARQTAAALCPRVGGVQTGIVLGHVNVPPGAELKALKVLAQWSDDTVAVDSAVKLAITKRRHWLETTTDASASYRLCGLPLAGDVELRARVDTVAGPPALINLATRAPYARVDLALQGTDRSAMFSGRVLTDRTGVPILSAEVSLPDIKRTVLTNEQGAFHVTGIVPGSHRVSVRHIGYGPFDTTFVFGDNQSLERAVVLPKVTVLDSVVSTQSNVIPSFEANKHLGLGQFKTRSDLERMEQSFVSTVLRDFQGMEITNGGGWANKNAQYATMTKGAERCLANVYIDDMPVYIGDRGGPPFDLGSIMVSELEAIEFYRRPEEIPLKYSQGRSPCGVLVLWTRRGSQ